MSTKGIGNINLHDDRIGEERFNNQGCLMKIVDYKASRDIMVEFQDDHHSLVHTQYYNFKNGQVKNPYYPSVYNVGIIGDKYPVNKNSKPVKEYSAWTGMLRRCYTDKFKLVRPTYKNATCCSEWLLYENFYEWLHSQKNFNKWLNEGGWAVDKDILIKGNKIYSPDACCLVPPVVNSLFVKSDKKRGSFPIGVTYNEQNKMYMLSISKRLYHYKNMYFDTPIQAFEAYKQRKEDIIKQVAQKEFAAGNITKQCYDAMMNYEVEITD